jgi:branched-chain amino acid transport system permease protein
MNAAFQDAILAGIGIQAAAFALAAVGLNLQFGYTGLLNFGHVAFMLVGAYGAAITVNQGGPLWLGVLVGVAAAVGLGLVFGLPTLRLRADYLAIVTITAGETLRLVVNSGSQTSLTQGPFGIQRFANSFFNINPIPSGTYGAGRVTFANTELWVVVVAWALVIVADLLVYRLVSSPWGRAIRAIREDEDAARSLGKNTFAYKLQSLVLGGIMGALAGVMLAIDQQSVSPGYYLPYVTFFVFTMVILGGPGTVQGPIVGAILFWFLIQLTAGVLTDAVVSGWIPSGLLSTDDVLTFRFVLVGASLIGLAIWRPQGIFGKREELLIDAR